MPVIASMTTFRIRLSEQVEELKADSQVLVTGITEEPQACVKADQAAIDGFFDLKLYVPLPDYGSRRVCALASLECSAAPLQCIGVLQVCHRHLDWQSEE